MRSSFAKLGLAIALLTPSTAGAHTFDLASEMPPDLAAARMFPKLVQFKQLLGTLYGEPADTARDQLLTQLRLDYGRAGRCCFENGPSEAGAPKTIDLASPAALVDASADAAPIIDANVVPPKDAGAEIETAAAGCACDATGTSGPALAWLATMGAVFVRLARRRKT